MTPNAIANALIATSAPIAGSPDRPTSSALECVVAKQNASTASEIVITAAPETSILRRPTLSMIAIATNVEATLTITVMILMRNALPAEKPTACQSAFEYVFTTLMPTSC